MKPWLSVTVDEVLPRSNWRLNLRFHLVRTAANAQIVAIGNVHHPRVWHSCLTFFLLPLLFPQPTIPDFTPSMPCHCKRWKLSQTLQINVAAKISISSESSVRSSNDNSLVSYPMCMQISLIQNFYQFIEPPPPPPPCLWLVLKIRFLILE